MSKNGYVNGWSGRSHPWVGASLLSSWTPQLALKWLRRFWDLSRAARINDIVRFALPLSSLSVSMYYLYTLNWQFRSVKRNRKRHNGRPNA